MKLDLKGSELFCRRNMNKFALMVKEVASPDLGRMGMELLSFTIKDVRLMKFMKLN